MLVGEKKICNINNYGKLIKSRKWWFDAHHIKGTLIF